MPDPKAFPDLDESQMLREPDLTGYHSYADYYQYQTEGYYELIKGWLVKMAGPREAHQAMLAPIFRILDAHFGLQGCLVRLAPYDVRLFHGLPEAQDTVVQPDICVICDRSKIDGRGCNGAPDLCIEIISKSSAKHDRTTKVTLYEQAGVREYWIVDYKLRRIERRTLTAAGRYPLPTLYGVGENVISEALPGLELSVDQVFAAVIV